MARRLGQVARLGPLAWWTLSLLSLLWLGRLGREVAFLASLRHADFSRECLFIGAHPKWSIRGQNDANAPSQTGRKSVITSADQIRSRLLGATRRPATTTDFRGTDTAISSSFLNVINRRYHRGAR